MSNKSSKQILLRIGDDIVGKAVIRRGLGGEGYFYEGEDKTTNAKHFMIPLTQSDVTEIFASENKTWRTEQ